MFSQITNTVTDVNIIFLRLFLREEANLFRSAIIEILIMSQAFVPRPRNKEPGLSIDKFFVLLKSFHNGAPRWQALE